MLYSSCFLINDYIKTEARQLNPMDSLSDVLPGLRDASPMMETWHHHHGHPLVIAGTELAGSSNTGVLIHIIGEKTQSQQALYNADPDPWLYITGCCRFGLRCNCWDKKDHLRVSELSGKQQ